jgi:hypothetical protein
VSAWRLRFLGTIYHVIPLSLRRSDLYFIPYRRSQARFPGGLGVVAGRKRSKRLDMSCGAARAVAVFALAAGDLTECQGEGGASQERCDLRRIVRMLGQNVHVLAAGRISVIPAIPMIRLTHFFGGARFGMVGGERGRRLKLRPQPPVGRRKRAHAPRAIEKGTGRATAIYWMGSSVTRAASGCSGRITFCDVVVRSGDDVTTSSGRVNW